MPPCMVSKNFFVCLSVSNFDPNHLGTGKVSDLNTLVYEAENNWKIKGIYVTQTQL